jgi:predicted GTPase
MERERIVILGAAGRDFHDFNVVFRADSNVEVVAFTATQIPEIAGRRYPRALAGPLYPDGIPILEETELEALVRAHGVSQVVLSYSDLPHAQVMHLASRALAVGADFRMLGPRRTMLASRRPVIAVCAVRTGCGKSPACRYVASVLRETGARVAVVRHPMPYGDLERQRVQRFATRADLDAMGDGITLEEREEYEPHVDEGTVVFAGVDYAAILEAAEREADVIVWDGGNNDLPFYRPDLWITIADPHRAGHELSYHPGETNVRAADLVVIGKSDSAKRSDIDTVAANVRAIHPGVDLVEARLQVEVDDPALVAGKRVLLVEDGPTLTHGEMPFGAGQVVADRLGAAEVVDPRPYARGSIARLYERWPHLGRALPAMGYFPAQLAELFATIDATDCDTVVIATPIDLRRLGPLRKPSTRVRYRFVEPEPALLAARVRAIAHRGG